MRKLFNTLNMTKIVDNKKLRYGYTTGSCSTAAAAAATIMLITKKPISEILVNLPNEIDLIVKVNNIIIKKEYVSCSITKDAGDDPDSTDGIEIFGKVSFNETNHINITGGLGIGTVTKNGLPVEIGKSAINPIPCQMIKENVKKVLKNHGISKGVDIEISAPMGVEIAKKTFNPRIGIVGGISILGTSGLVEPMSQKALVDSIEVLIKQQISSNHKYLLISPGNMGKDFIEKELYIDTTRVIKCSNFIGETIDMAINDGAKGILFVGHIGKFIKLAGGIMNTHSHSADCRKEIFLANGILAGGDINLAHKIMESNTTDEILGLLKDYNLMEKTMDLVMEKIHFYLNSRSYEQITLGAIVFSTTYGFLGKTIDTDILIEHINKGD